MLRRPVPSGTPPSDPRPGWRRRHRRRRCARWQRRGRRRSDRSRAVPPAPMAAFRDHRPPPGCTNRPCWRNDPGTGSRSWPDRRTPRAGCRRSRPPASTSGTCTAAAMVSAPPMQKPMTATLPLCPFRCCAAPRRSWCVAPRKSRPAHQMVGLVRRRGHAALVEVGRERVVAGAGEAVGNARRSGRSAPTIPGSRRCPAAPAPRRPDNPWSTRRRDG